jgi:hypothetical protein
MAVETTWLPETHHGKLASGADLDMLPNSVFAFYEHRALPLVDAEHVKDALHDFHSVEDATEADRDQAFANILAAAEHYEVPVEAADWRELPRG